MNKIILRRDMSKPLNAPAPLPNLYDIVKDDGSQAGAWEWIMAGAFPEIKPSYEVIASSERPVQVFFLNEYSQPSAAVALFEEDGCARLDWLAVHPYAREWGFGRHVIHAALCYAQEKGFAEALAEADEAQTAAIRELLEAGFEPTEGGEMVCARARAYEGKKREKIALWADGSIPYFEEGQEIPAIEGYPVENSRGAVVICPGGAYCIRASHEGRQIARMLNEAGVSAYVLDYRVRPCHYEAPLTDAKRAVRLLRAMGYEKVGIMGFSAGGHLTCSAATLYDSGNPEAADPIDRLSSRPDAFIPCYPVVSFVNFCHQGSVNALLDNHRGQLKLKKRFSAELNVTGDTPPAFIWHTMTDQSVPVENSLNLASALTHAGVLFEMHIFPEGPHGLGLAGGNPVIGKWAGLCQRWLIEQGFGKRGEQE